MKRRLAILTLCTIAWLTTFAIAQHDHNHQATGVEKRGDAVMGFDHDKTTHHFTLTKDGGVIQVTANDAADKDSIAAIRSHLPHIAMMFAGGDFEAPMLVHDKTPPGSKVMAERKEKIQYQYADVENGGKIVISTADEAAIKAVHEFLRMQIKEHKTGDPMKP